MPEFNGVERCVRGRVSGMKMASRIFSAGRQTVRRPPGRLRAVLAGAAAAGLMAGGLVGGFATVASATSTGFTLTMSSGTFGAHGNTPTALPTPASLAGTVNSTTGAITAGTLTIPSWNETNTGSSESLHIFDVHAGTATGTIDYHGNVTINDTATIQIHITSPINETCTSTPVHLILQSTSPYNPTTGNVNLSDTTFSIPNFSSSTCTFAAGTLNSRFAGSTGNVLTLNLHGTLPEPPPPTVSSSTTLSVTPASPQLQGTSVTMSAAVKKSTGAPATTATGTMDFYSGTTLIAAQAVTGGTAGFATSGLAPGTDRLKAVYSGNATYAGSTSATTTYVIKPVPSVTLTPHSLKATRGGSPVTFAVTVANPSTGQAWPSLRMKLGLNGIQAVTGSQVSLAYKN